MPGLYRNRGRGRAKPGYAMARQQRDINLNRGFNTIHYSDVAAFINTTMVMFESLTDPAAFAILRTPINIP